MAHRKLCSVDVWGCIPCALECGRRQTHLNFTLCVIVRSDSASTISLNFVFWSSRTFHTYSPLLAYLCLILSGYFHSPSYSMCSVPFPYLHYPYSHSPNPHTHTDICSISGVMEAEEPGSARESPATSGCPGLSDRGGDREISQRCPCHSGSHGTVRCEDSSLLQLHYYNRVLASNG